MYSVGASVALALSCASFQAQARAEPQPILRTSPASIVYQQATITSGLLDSDGDGVSDVVDLDDDNDGILDSDEGDIDTDGDNIPDSLDLDSDNDGIFDIYEARTDAKETQKLDRMPDGVIDISNSVGGNGIADIIETLGDSGSLKFPLPDLDEDGTPDFRDLDTDDDGIFDIIEIGGPDSDSNGRVDNFNDEDGDGIDDTIRGYPYPLYDTDGDGELDYRDLDSDNDTVPDRVEGGDDPSAPRDTDGDGSPDYLDRDSDADGISDRRESGANPAEPLDSDSDGIEDYRDDTVPATQPLIDTINGPDEDGDTIVNQIDLDDDNDGISDLNEGLLDENGDGFADDGSVDTDGDGVPDGFDLDSDGDGIGDIIEAGGVDVDNNGRIDVFNDIDGNGVDDVLKVSTLPLFDTDDDKIRDNRDLDSDNDGIPDSVETNGPLGSPTDSDGDGIADYREKDSDNDGIRDEDEVGPDPAAPVDTDGNGTPDFQQESVTVVIDPAIPDIGADHDNDGLPDVSDPDDDNDGLSDELEGDGDADSDGVANSRDQDSDNDGVLDRIEGGNDADADGVADYLDLDSDNDGIYDAVEAASGVISTAGRLITGDSDAFGLLPGASDQNLDSDGDGVPDRLDLDSDNDGLTDVLEARMADNDLDARIDPTADANANGADDSLTSRDTQPDDRDGDGIPNFRDLDSDQDGLADIVENFGTLADQDNDGRIDNFTSPGDGDGLDDNIAASLAGLRDSDGDGQPNSLDLDSDGDGINDLVEGGGVDANDDGIVDNLVPDNDGDGFAEAIVDGSVIGQGQPITLPDMNNDGTPDVYQANVLDSGVVETSIGGLGCSVATASAGIDGRKDPLMWLLLTGSLMFLWIKRFGTTVMGKLSSCTAGIRRAAVITGGAITLSGCGVTQLLPVDEGFNQRVYVGGGVLVSRLEPDTSDAAGVSVSDSSSSGAGLLLGYDLNNRVSAEVHVADLGKSTLSPDGSIDYQVAAVSAVIYGLSAEENRRQREGFTAFGRLGLGTLENDATVVRFRRVNDINVTVGAGVEYGFSNGVAARAELQAHETDAKYVQGSILYRFGATGAQSRDNRSAIEEPVPQAAEPIVTDLAAVDLDTVEVAVVDSDADGISDALDVCPETADSLPVDESGCELFDGVIEGVNFLTGSTELTDGAMVALDGVADTLKQYPAVKVTIEAHTDDVGDPRENLILSRRRALAVARYLRDQDIRGSRLAPKAFGDAQPRESNSTPEGRAANRRVEFSIYQ